MPVLVFNAGSSSLKISLLDEAAGGPTTEPLIRETIPWGDDASRGADASAVVARALATVDRVVDDRGSIRVVAHRVVHGGPDFTAPVLVDDDVLAALDALAPLAPLHDPVAVATIRAARRAMRDCLQVAVFDTAFHATLPEVARRYPVPDAWVRDWGVRRYGFHGLSVAWSVERASSILGRPIEDLGLVVAHLGSGCSVTAVLGGRSVATSMGMTPLEGLMMGTRAGSIDPGILIRLLADGHLSLPELDEALEHQAGLLGVSGLTADIRRLLEASAAGNRRASVALDMFVDRAAAGIAAAATALRHVDGIVLTGGIGEHAGGVRAAIAQRLGVLGVAPIEASETGEDRRIRPLDAKDPGEVPLLRIEAREDVVAARGALGLL